MTIDTFTRAYLECALWSSTDGETALDDSYGISDFTPEALVRAVEDCASFQERVSEHICDNLELAGHDFWLTRNGHGAGFWDGDWPESSETLLTELAQSYGDCYLYVTDDGKIDMG